LELWLLTCARATATPNPSHVCDLHHSSQQHQILNPVSEARDHTHNLMVPSWIRFCSTTSGTPDSISFKSDVKREKRSIIFNYSLNTEGYSRTQDSLMQPTMSLGQLLNLTSSGVQVKEILFSLQGYRN